MKLDVNHTLYEMRSLMAGGAPHEDDFLLFKRFKARAPLVFVDVGANAGQSAISFLMNCPVGRVISYEPNELYAPVLVGVRELLGAARFEFHVYGLSDIECELDLHVPHVDSVPYMQEASLDLSQFQKPWVRDRLHSYGEHLDIVSVRAGFKIADHVIDHADIVKIDAEGAEMSVLRGMEKLILNSSPVFLVENNDWDNVTEFLKGYGYGVYQYRSEIDALVNMAGPSTNCFYLRREHFDSYSIALEG